MLNLQSNVLLNTESSTNTQAVERWDHSGFDRLQKEDEGTWHKIKNPKKQKVAAEGDYKRSNQRNNSKWTNNKEDNDISTRVTNDTKHGSKGTRKDRKPDRQLYSVRDKRADNQTQNNNNNRKTRAGNNMALPLNMVKEAEGHAFDDDKSFVSNVSTAISERLKIEDDQEKVMLSGNEYHSLNTSSPKTSNEESRVLFSLCLGVEDDNSFETVFIYEGETDYEGFLDEVCTRYGILDRTALYFKINVLQMIMGVHSNPSVVEPTLNKFLDINYNLLLTEVETEEDVASPLFYGENEDSFAGNTSTDSC